MIHFSASDLPPFDDVAVDRVAADIDVDDLQSIVFLIVDNVERAIAFSRRIDNYRGYDRVTQELLKFLYNSNRNNQKNFQTFHSRVIAALRLTNHLWPYYQYLNQRTSKKWTKEHFDKAEDQLRNFQYQYLVS